MGSGVAKETPPSLSEREFASLNTLRMIDVYRTENQACHVLWKEEDCNEVGVVQQIVANCWSWLVMHTQTPHHYVYTHVHDGFMINQNIHLFSKDESISTHVHIHYQFDYSYVSCDLKNNLIQKLGCLIQ